MVHRNIFLIIIFLKASIFHNLFKNEFTASNQEKIGEIGGIDVILAVMKEHIDKKEICESGCTILLDVTDNGKLTHL